MVTENPLAEEHMTAVRARFPSTGTLAYLNNGSYGLLSDRVEAAVREYLDLRLRSGADWDAWVERSFQVASKLSTLIGCALDEVAITGSASSGINAVASALDFSGSRNRVVVSNFEFPTSGQIWHAQEPRGAVVEHIAEAGNRRIPLEHFEKAIDERTRIVAISHVCYRHGAKFSDDEVRQIAAMAHRHGAYLILDSFQSLGAEPIDVKALDVDFMVGGMYKYLLGTAGIGFLYARRDAADALVPTTSGWFAQADVGAMDIFANVPGPTASRFQGGTPPVLGCYAADAGIGIILDYGAERIADRIRSLTAYALDQFREAGFQIATPLDAHGPMIALRCRDAAALVEALIKRDIVTSHRDGNVRAGFHFYNNRDDISRLVEALADNRAFLSN